MASQAPTAHTTAPAHGWRSSKLPDIKLLMWIFLASDIMFFGTLIGTYLIYKGRSLTGPYPLDVLDIPLTTVSTFVLLMSSFLMVIALDALRKNDIQKFRLWTFGVILFGGIFLGFQIYEFNHFVDLGLTLGGNLFGSTFYVLTGTHGVHVAIGILWLGSILVSSYIRPWTAKDEVYLEVAGLYWHFVDLVWIVIFTLVYLVDFV
jgi:heme/copper-type cytochrome/quinol oxidase subunit 3